MGILLKKPNKEIKKRQKNEPSDFTKSLKKIREHHTPLHTIEVEIEATKLQS